MLKFAALDLTNSTFKVYSVYNLWQNVEKCLYIRECVKNKTDSKFTIDI